MKKRISLLAALLILAAAVFGTPAATADITVVQVTKAASVRSAPGFNSDKLALAETGAQYPFLGEESGRYEVQLDATRAGFLPKAAFVLPIAIVLMVVTLFVLRSVTGKKAAA